MKRESVMRQSEFKWSAEAVRLRQKKGQKKNQGDGIDAMANYFSFSLLTMDKKKMIIKKDF